MCVCVCVVRERERAREREADRQTDRQRFCLFSVCYVYQDFTGNRMKHTTNSTLLKKTDKDTDYLSTLKSLPTT